MASTVNMAQGYERQALCSAIAGAHMHNAIQYQLEVPTARNRTLSSNAG